jgi:glutamate synthase (NADPH/NADH) large chain
MVFLPRDGHARAARAKPPWSARCRRRPDFAGLARRAHRQLLSGSQRAPTEPVIRQAFVQRGPNCPDTDAFERKLFVIRKQTHHAIWDRELLSRQPFYIASLSSRTLVYKGMILARNLGVYYPDLRDRAWNRR